MAESMQLASRLGRMTRAGRAGRAGRPRGRAEHLARGRRTAETAGLDDEAGQEAISDGGWARVRRRRDDARCGPGG